MAESSPQNLSIERLSTGVYRATNSRGNTLDFGSKYDEGFTPIELLLAAIAGCSAVDVDMVTSRQAEPDRFVVSIESNKVVEDEGSALQDIVMTFDLAFPETEEGEKAWKRVPNAVRASHDRHCTVSRTVELGTPVEVRINEQ